LTAEVLSAIDKRSKKKNNQKATDLYQAVSTMKEFNLSPAEWRRLSRLDKKILIYSRVMEQHYIDCIHEEHNRKLEQERKRREMMDRMPKLAIPRRR